MEWMYAMTCCLMSASATVLESHWPQIAMSALAALLLNFVAPWAWRGVARVAGVAWWCIVAVCGLGRRELSLACQQAPESLDAPDAVLIRWDYTTGRELDTAPLILATAGLHVGFSSDQCETVKAVRAGDIDFLDHLEPRERRLIERKVSQTVARIRERERRDRLALADMSMSLHKQHNRSARQTGRRV